MLKTLAAMTFAGCLSGCIVGPKALEVSRTRYAVAIQKTTDEQLLLNLVRLQYREAPVFLEVGSVSAQFVFEESAGATGTINEGPTAFNADVLGLSTGFKYQERPTITFTPLQGKDFVNKLLSPLQPEVMVLLSRSGWSIDRVMRLTVQSINGVDNASSASGPTPKLAPEYESFARISELFRALQQKRWLVWGIEQRETTLSMPLSADQVTLPAVVQAVKEGYRVRMTDDGSRLVLAGSSPVLVWRIPPAAAHSDEVGELVTLLGLKADRTMYEVYAGVDGESASGGPNDLRGEIRVSMRSLMGTLFYLSQGIDVPKAHRQGGLVTTTMDADGVPFDWSLVTGPLLHIRSRLTHVVGAAVNVRHRGYWFFIDDTDLSSKSTLVLLGQLFALQAGGVESVTPVLTLPVGG